MSDLVVSTLRVASVCMNSGERVEENFTKAEEYCRKAHEQGASWVVLPEMFSYMGSYPGLCKASVHPDSGPFKKLRDLCSSLGLTLYAGSVGEMTEKEILNEKAGYRKVHNTLYALDKNGRQMARYRKTHLFNLRDEHQNVLYSEEQGFYPGNELVRIRHEGWRIGFAICYDIRFPAMFTKMTLKEPLDVLVVPAAFTETTGKRHWHLLLRARAVELQCYVIGADQTGFHGDERKECYGHSVIIDPWGEVLADTGKNPGLAVSDISLAHLQTYRDKLPIRANQRSDLY